MASPPRIIRLQLKSLLKTPDQEYPSAAAQRRGVVPTEGDTKFPEAIPMPMRYKKVSPALKHGAYSEAVLLPGENPAEFEELHRGLVEELTPHGRLEEETIAALARLVWRRQNLQMFEIGQLSHLIATALEKAAAKEPGERDSLDDDEIISEFNELAEANQRYDKAQGTRKEKAGSELFEISKTATLKRLMKELDVEERLDAMIDKLIKRLLFLRGLKSITSSAATPSPSTAQKRLRPRTEEV
jgi:hypothetical protein